jgi:hypothetical protein
MIYFKDKKILQQFKHLVGLNYSNLNRFQYFNF